MFKVLEKFNFNTLANHVRTFTDYLIESFQAIGNNQQEALNYIDFLNRMIWTHVSTGAFQGTSGNDLSTSHTNKNQ